MLALASAMTACGGGGGDSGDGVDAGPMCTDTDCDDGLFCNGVETCAPDDPTADERGCAAAPAGPCMPGQECDEDTDRCRTMCDVTPDADGDGRVSTDCGGDDCDDSSAARYPGNVELCDPDDVDEDCDARTFGFRDSDGDAHPDALCCNEDEAGERYCGDDCNDARPDIYAGLVEACDGEDNDCDGTTDEGVLETFWPDADGDGFGSSDPAASTMTGCARPMGYSDTNDDCDDTRGSVNPAATEQCDEAMIDEDCDGEANPASLCMCAGDVTRPCTLPGACAAGTERCVAGSWGMCSIAPIAEVCNGIDDDCDGTIDETLTIVCYTDDDDDTFASPGVAPMTECPTSGRAEVGGCRFGLTNRAPSGTDVDCNDARDDVHPLAPELCDAGSVDEDCDGMTNEGCTCTGTETRTCGLPGRCSSGVESCAGGAWGPCSISPRSEICDGVDDDCDGFTDEGLLVDCWTDMDNDTYAPSSATLTPRCACGSMYTVRAPTGTEVDCDDTTASRSPAVPEACNGTDEDCDAIVDEELPLQERYVDTDGDGRPGTPVMRCVGDPGSAPAETDCNETDVTVYDGAPELCDGIDNNCDYSPAGGVDPGEDSDGDGFAPIGAMCTGGPYPATDCDDDRASDYPGALEICDGFDNDCDGSPDEDPAADASCSGAMATVECVGAGTAAGCAVISCTDGYRDCDGDAANGCETNLLDSPAHCGACGIDCGAGGVCAAGLCDAIVAVSAGENHTCALRGSGTAACWGLSSFGRLGTPAGPTAASTPDGVSGLTDAVEISAGGPHTCARRAGGTVVCWGNNVSGQLGIGSFGSLRSVPTEDVVGLTDAVEVVSGLLANTLAHSHSCARRATGAVVCWGDNEFGQLGNGTTTDSATPVPVTGLTDAVDISAGRGFTCAVRSGGTVQCWGINAYGQLGDGTITNSTIPVSVIGLTSATSVSAGGWHACAHHGTGFSCWGRNSRGQLGNGGTTDSAMPVSTGIADAVTAAGSTGLQHTCVARAAGGVSCFGFGGAGALGGGGTMDSTTPVPVVGLGDAIQADMGGSHSCALRAQGSVVCWGGNTDGQLGNGTVVSTNEPDTSIALASVEQIDGGYDHTCGRRASGALFCWGGNVTGQLGVASPSQTSVPLRIDGVNDALDVDMGWGFTCALRASGAVTCFGRNDYGQLGDGTTTDRSMPMNVMGVTDAVGLVVGHQHACARRATGGVVCWGRNQSGQLGDGSMIDRATPVAVTGITNARDLAAGNAHTCARTATGEILCWGTNGSYQLGAGSGVTGSPTPLMTVGIDDAVQVDAGSLHGCALRATGEVACWGTNIDGQVGDGTSTLFHPTPVAVPGLVDAVEIALSSTHSCARRATGAVVCWGDNAAGGLGDGTTTNSRSPVTVLDGSMDLAGGRHIGTGYTHSCAQTGSFGGYMCWGGNVQGQLGVGDFVDRTTATLVFDLP